MIRRSSSEIMRGKSVTKENLAVQQQIIRRSQRKIRKRMLIQKTIFPKIAKPKRFSCLKHDNNI